MLLSSSAERSKVFQQLIEMFRALNREHFRIDRNHCILVEKTPAG